VPLPLADGSGVRLPEIDGSDPAICFEPMRAGGLPAPGVT